MDRELELNFERDRLRKKLDQLTERVEYEENYVKGLDVYGQSKVTTRGSKKEIEEVKAQLEKIEKQIKEVIKHKKERAEMEKASEAASKEAEARRREKEAEDREYDEIDRKVNFRAIKRRYKKGPLTERVLDKIVPFRYGKPDWKKIKKYTSEELEFLAHVAAGSTLMQEERRKEDVKHEDFREKKSKYTTNWKEFSRVLGSRSKLKSAMEYEEELMHEKYGMR